MKIEYNNLYTHFIFTTLHRLPLILEDNWQRIEKYMTGVVNHHDCKMVAIYANPEHVHLFVTLAPHMDEEHLADLVAIASSHFIMKTSYLLEILNIRYGSAFSVSKRDIDKVCKYILNQKEHHHKQTFAEEYEEFLKFYQQTITHRKQGNKGGLLGVWFSTKSPTIRDRTSR